MIYVGYRFRREWSSRRLCLHDAAPRSLLGRPLCFGGFSSWSAASALRDVRRTSGPSCPDFTRPAQFRCEWTYNLEQVAGCIALCGSDTAGVQAQLEDPPVSSGAVRFRNVARRRCDDTVILAPDINVQTYLLTYLLEKFPAELF